MSSREPRAGIAVERRQTLGSIAASADGNGASSPSLRPSERDAGRKPRNRVCGGICVERRPDEPGAVAHVGDGLRRRFRHGSAARRAAARPARPASSHPSRRLHRPAVAATEDAPPASEAEQRGSSAADGACAAAVRTTGPHRQRARQRQRCLACGSASAGTTTPIDIASALRREFSEPSISASSGVDGWPGRARRARPP